MPFTEQQLQQLKTKVPKRFIRCREVNGRSLSYIEGWHVVAEANRIFGFDGWDRETVETRCVWTKQNGDRYSAAYVTRVRVTVLTGERRIVRDGTGVGETTADSPGQAHEIASKIAETDATKRAFITFGNPFGLSLYSETGRATTSRERSALPEGHPVSDGNSFPKSPDSPASVRPQQAPQALSVEPIPGNADTAIIDKSQLPLSEPKRVRNKAHLRFVASKGCTVCGRYGSQAHHLTFAQPRALSRKSSDEFTVPLCATHHRELHGSGNERAWWNAHGVDPLPIARDLWSATIPAR